MNTKNFAICLKDSIFGFKAGKVYDLEIESLYGRNMRVQNNGCAASFSLNDEHFCFILNVTPELEAKLKGGAS